MNFPKPDTPDLTNWLKLKGDWAVTSDWHIPYHDYKFCNTFVKLCKKLKIKNLLIAGDFFDFYSMSDYDKYDPAESLKHELSEASKVLDILTKNFSNITIFIGNHERRVLRHLSYQLGLADIIKLITKKASDIGKKIIISEYPYCTINNWRITHSSSYSRISTRTAQALASKYGMNILNAHGHHLGLTKDLSGKWWTGDTGGMFDISKIEYVMKSCTTHPVWNQGFFILKNNKPYMFSPELIHGLV